MHPRSNRTAAHVQQARTSEVVLTTGMPCSLSTLLPWQKGPLKPIHHRSHAYGTAQRARCQVAMHTCVHDCAHQLQAVGVRNPATAGSSPARKAAAREEHDHHRISGAGRLITLIITAGRVVPSWSWPISGLLMAGLRAALTTSSAVSASGPIVPLSGWARVVARSLPGLRFPRPLPSPRGPRRSSRAPRAVRDRSSARFGRDPSAAWVVCAHSSSSSRGSYRRADHPTCPKQLEEEMRERRARHVGVEERNRPLASPPHP